MTANAGSTSTTSRISTIPKRPRRLQFSSLVFFAFGFITIGIIIMITAISRTMVLETQIRISHRLAPWSSARKGALRRTARKSSSSPFSQKHGRYSRRSGVVVVEAMRIPTLLPVARSFRLGTAQHDGRRSFQSTASSTSSTSPLLHKPSSLQSTRLFSGNANENNNSEIKHEVQETSNHSSVPQPQKELSKLAKSVRDKVTSLLLSTTTMEGEIDSSPPILIPIVVSVSGGCDSVALFHALMEWKGDLQKQQSLQYQQQQENVNRDKSLLLQLDITVVHFHHRQRPVEADEDCRLVRELVESHNKKDAESDDCVDNPISFRLEDWNDQTTIDSQHTATNDGGEEGEASTSFSQDKARVWRRNKLRECAEERLSSLTREHQTGIATKEDSSNSSNVGDTTASSNTKRIPFGIVLTAHHDDDSYETVLIKLLRGVHLLNLHDRATIASIARMEDNVENDRTDNASNEMAHLLPPLVGNAREKSEENQKEERAIPPIYLVRPFVTDSTTLPDAVMPGHTKEELVQYLLDRGLSWREDASNHDPNSKYLRNRVRNELIPLLQDLTDDSFRNKRVPALLEQSRELNEDLEPRVQEYLDRVVVEKECASFFSILTPGDDNNQDSDSDSDSRLVRSQALYHWMSACVAAQESPSLPFSISYESLQRVVQQLDKYPHRKTWKLELGLGWNVERTGDFLRMTYDGGDDKPFDSSMESKRGSYQTWEWTRVSQKDNSGEESTSQKENENLLRIQVPSAMLESSIKFVSMTLKEAEANQIARASNDTAQSSLTSLRFSPPWRNSSVKLRAFLRGQKVPAHLRDDTQLLFFIENEEVTTTTMHSADEKDEHSINSPSHPNRLVALQVGDKWMVDKKFHIGTSTESGNETKTGNQQSPVATLGNKTILQLERRKDE